MTIFRFLILFISLIPVAVQGRGGPLIARDTTAYSLRRNSFFIEPVALVDIMNGLSLRVGAEYGVGRSWALAGTGGYYFDTKKGWIGKIEVKKYLKQPGKTGDLRYFSTECYYRTTTYRQLDSFRIPGIADYGKDYTIDKHIAGICLKYGAVRLLAHKVVLDYYAGIGVRYRAATATISDMEYEHIDYNLESMIFPYTSAISKKMRPDITLGIRLGIRY